MYTIAFPEPLFGLFLRFYIQPSVNFIHKSTEFVERTQVLSFASTCRLYRVIAYTTST